MSDTMNNREKKALEKDTNPQTVKRRNELFKLLIEPEMEFIYKLCLHYSCNYSWVDDNYSEVLTNFYKRIESYDPSKTKSIKTWIHVCTKHQILRSESKRFRKSNDLITKRFNSIGETGEEEETEDSNDYSRSRAREYIEINDENIKNYCNDDIIELLETLDPNQKEAFLLYQAGYEVREIAAIQHQLGHLESQSFETVKSRLRATKRLLRQSLTRDGKRIYNKADLDPDRFFDEGIDLEGQETP